MGAHRVGIRHSPQRHALIKHAESFSQLNKPVLTAKVKVYYFTAIKVTKLQVKGLLTHDMLHTTRCKAYYFTATST
jgi:hypothetical protein